MGGSSSSSSCRPASALRSTSDITGDGIPLPGTQEGSPWLSYRGKRLKLVEVFFCLIDNSFRSNNIYNSYWLTILNRDVYAVLYRHQIKWKVHVYGSVFPHIELFMRLDYWIQHKALSFKSTGICSMKFNKVKWNSCVLQWETFSHLFHANFYIV